MVEENECMDLLKEVVNQACSLDDVLDSGAIRTYADALLFLEKKGYVTIISKAGRRVIAKWK